MNQKVNVVVTAIALVMAVNSYASKPKVTFKVMRTVLGGAPSSFSHVVLRDFYGQGPRIVPAQIARIYERTVLSQSLRKDVYAGRSLAGYTPQQSRFLQERLAHADTAGKPNASRRVAKVAPLPTRRAGAEPQTEGMAQLLNLQGYMLTHKNEFPRLCTINASGALIVDITAEKETVFLNVLDILIKAQAGKIEPAMIEQLIALYATASNPISEETLEAQLKIWQKENATEPMPRLPQDVSTVSLRDDGPALHLAVEKELRRLANALN